MDSDWYPFRDLNLQATTPASSDAFLAETLVKRTFDLLERGETEIELHEQFRKVVLILGDTGNGKSKLTQWIAGDDTKLISRITEEDEFIIEDINATDRSVITSDTIYPQLVVDDETNTVYCDNPGFNDTRDESNEIAATYFIKKVVDHAESVKLIFVINYPSVRKGVERHNFMKLAKHFADFLKHIEKFQGSIALVVTKVDNRIVQQGEHFVLIDDNKIIAGIAHFLMEVKQELEMKLEDGSSNERQLHEAAVKLISILLVRDGEQYARIGIFRRPNKPGPVSEIPLLQEGKVLINRMIHEKLIFSEKEFDDFGYTISDKCKNKIHYFVEDINRSVWSCLCRVKEEIIEHYAKIINVLRSNVQSFLDERSPSANLEEARELSTRLTDGLRSLLSLVEDVGNVTNPEDLAQKINAVISILNIDISKNDLLDIENNGKYFNFLQVVSDKQLSIRPWKELIREVEVYLSNARKQIQEYIDVVAPEICKNIESDFEQIAKALKDQFDEKTKLLDMKEALDLLTNYQDVMFKVAEETKNKMCTTEVLKIVRDATRDININLPERSMLNAQQREKYFLFLKSIREMKIDFVPSIWTRPFQRVVKHLNESKIWYIFLDRLYYKFSEYEMQKDREKYNVSNIKDWGKTGKPQGIVVTEKIFQQFLKNIAKCNIVKYDDIQNITLTELRLYELNQLLNLTLKHRADIQYKSPSIFVRGDYITIKEIAVSLKHNLGNDHNLLAALKSGVYKFLNILALRKVFIDEDISLPGMELSIISPKWEIIGNRIISLDGVDAEPHSEIKAEDGAGLGCHGRNGKPGMPGKPGGNFFGIGASIINETHLTVTVNGGSGGPGQHGGNGQEGEQGSSVELLSDDDLPSRGDDGGNGQEGELGSSAELLSDDNLLIRGDDGITRIRGSPCENVRDWCSNSILVAILKFLGLKVEDNSLYRINGLPGETGGDGGNGGKGGFGGNPGVTFIFNLGKDSRKNMRGNKGKDGEDGRGGEGGNGGKSGKALCALLNGIFIREWVYQFYEDAGAVSTGLRGSRGTPGYNSSGLKSPEPSNDMSKAFQIILAYENYAEENFRSRFKDVLPFNFIDEINRRVEI